MGDASGLTFGQVDAVLARFAEIDPGEKSRATWRTRVKQWQKPPFNFPAGTKVGRGRKAVYGADQFFQLAMAVQLQRIGLPPERAIAATERFWHINSVAIADALTCYSRLDPHEHWIMFRIENYAKLQNPELKSKQGIVMLCKLFSSKEVWAEAEWLAGQRVKEPATEDVLQQFMFKLADGVTDAIIVDLDLFLRRIITCLIAENLSLAIFSEDILRWLKSAPDTVSRFHKEPKGRKPNAPELYPSTPFPRITNGQFIADIVAALGEDPKQSLSVKEVVHWEKKYLHLDQPEGNE